MVICVNGEEQRGENTPLGDAGVLMVYVWDVTLTSCCLSVRELVIH